MIEDLYEAQKLNFMSFTEAEKLDFDPLIVDIKVAQPSPIFNLLRRLEKINQ
jgi:hypothetical protein